MKRFWLLLSVLCFLAAAPAAYPCSVVEPPGPVMMSSLVYDPYFQQFCEMWTFSGNTEYGDSSGAVLSGRGYVEQDIYVPSSGGMEASFAVEVLTPGYSGDRLRAELRSSTGALLETIDIYTKDTPTDFYSYTNIPNNYYGQTIKLRLSYTHGLLGGTTVFRVSSANLWVF